MRHDVKLVCLPDLFTDHVYVGYLFNLNTPGSEKGGILLHGVNIFSSRRVKGRKIRSMFDFTPNFSHENFNKCMVGNVKNWIS